ncbi:MAG: STAS domain-containing protein [Thermoleophilaceae bacterium]
MNFHIEDESYKEDSVVIRLQGEVDLYAAPELKDHVNRAIESGKTKLILDLSEATFIDSTTLGILVSGMKRLRPRGGMLAVLCPDPTMARIFDITGLNRMFSVHDTLDAAMAALESTAPAQS